MITSGRCHHHGDRMGVGVCVECRRVICHECTTQFEGINRCSECLGRRLQALAAAEQVSEWGLGTVLLALFGVASLWGSLWLLAAGLSS
jgi:hypothetical protein